MNLINSVHQDPISIVLYGVTGVGKSCLAQAISQRIPNCRIVATDMLRKVLTRYSIDSITRESSYAITRKNALSPDDERNLINGYRKQNRVLVKAIKGVVEWSVDTNSSLIIEGINAFGFVSQSVAIETCHSFLVVCGDDEIHMKLLKRRYSTHPSPPISMTKYRKYFLNIRFMQEYLVREAIAKDHEILDPSLLGIASTADRVLRLIEAGGKYR